MRYAVIVYSIPLQCTSDDPTNHQGDTCPVHDLDAGEVAEYAQDTLAELIADEGVQRMPVLMDDQGLGMVEAALTSWALRDTNDAHKETQG